MYSTLIPILCLKIIALINHHGEFFFFDLAHLTLFFPLQSMQQSDGELSALPVSRYCYLWTELGWMIPQFPVFMLN